MKTRSKVMTIILAGGLALATFAPSQASTDTGTPRSHFQTRFTWEGPDGPLPFDEEQLLDFLRTARVTDIKYIGSGVSGAKKIRLEKEGVVMKAVFRDIDHDFPKALMEDGSYRFNFRDNAMFEVAAYELSRLLGLDNVPPTVERVVLGRRGSVQAWVKNAMTEKKRLKSDAQPPRGLDYYRQFQNMQVFDNLIHNDDRNMGNILIDSEWRVWLIDHTRSFRRHARLNQPYRIGGIERGLWARLRSIEDGQLTERLSPFIKPQELRGLLKRRQNLVSYIEGLIAEKGENRVLFSR